MLPWRQAAVARLGGASLAPEAPRPGAPTAPPAKSGTAQLGELQGQPQATGLGQGVRARAAAAPLPRAAPWLPVAVWPRSAGGPSRARPRRGRKRPPQRRQQQQVCLWGLRLSPRSLAAGCHQRSESAGQDKGIGRRGEREGQGARTFPAEIGSSGVCKAAGSCLPYNTGF